MVNKKGWLRIIEAGIAVLIIIGILLVITRTKSSSSSYDPSQEISQILKEIAKDSVMRDKIYQKQEGIEDVIKGYISSKMDRQDIDYRIRVCAINENEECELDIEIEDKEITSVERIISISSESTGQEFAPVKVKVYAWEKES